MAITFFVQYPGLRGRFRLPQRPGFLAAASWRPASSSQCPSWPPPPPWQPALRGQLLLGGRVFATGFLLRLAAQIPPVRSTGPARRYTHVGHPYCRLLPAHSGLLWLPSSCPLPPRRANPPELVRSAHPAPRTTDSIGELEQLSSGRATGAAGKTGKTGSTGQPAVRVSPITRETVWCRLARCGGGHAVDEGCLGGLSRPPPRGLFPPFTIPTPTSSPRPEVARSENEITRPRFTRKPRGVAHGAREFPPLFLPSSATASSTATPTISIAAATRWPPAVRPLHATRKTSTSRRKGISCFAITSSGSSMAPMWRLQPDSAQYLTVPCSSPKTSSARLPAPVPPIHTRSGSDRPSAAASRESAPPGRATAAGTPRVPVAVPRAAQRRQSAAHRRPAAPRRIRISASSARCRRCLRTRHQLAFPPRPDATLGPGTPRCRRFRCCPKAVRESPIPPARFVRPASRWAE